MATKKKARKKTVRKTGRRKKATAKKESPSRRKSPRVGKFPELFKGAPRDLKVVANKLHALVKKLLRHADETVYVDWRVAIYSGKNEICGIQPAPDYVKIYFQRATELDDPDEFLEGVGKNVRHVKLYPDEAFPETALRRLLVQAKKLDA